MAVTGVAARWQGRGATTDEKGVRTLKRQWLVETDTDLTGEPAVIDAVILLDPTAKLYAPHPLWAWAVCRKLTAEPFGGPRQWLVNAEYSSAPFAAAGDGSGTGANSSSPDQGQSNSTQADQRPPTISIARKDVTVPLEYDAVTGDRVVNDGPGDPFDPPPEVQRGRHLITLKFFRTPAQLNWVVRADYQDSVNDAVYTILGKPYPAYSLRCTDYSLDTVWETGPTGLALFFALTVQMEHNPDLWTVSVLNTGRRRRAGTGGFGDPYHNVAIVDEHGQPIADPVPLDEFGQPVPPGGPYHHVPFDGYVPKSWANILA